MAAKFTAIAEGDSWFHLPKFPIGLPIVGGSNTDTVRELQKRGHKINNIAHFGDTLSSIADARDYVGGLRSKNYDVLLLCGSGNDLLGDGKLYQYLRLYRKDRALKDYFKNSFAAKVRQLEYIYSQIIEDALDNSKNKNLKIVSHGYDYAIPGKNGYWLGTPMQRQGIVKKKLQTKLVEEMIDDLYRMLKRVRKKYPGTFDYVNLRNTVNGRWQDELHPRKRGFRDVAKRVEKKVLKVL